MRVRVSSRTRLLGAALVAGLCWIGPATVPAIAQETTLVLPQQQRLITVSGEAEVKVVPDEVVITLGLETSDTDLAKAKQLNNDRLKGVLAVADQFKIERKYVQVDFLSIQPSWQPSRPFKVRRRAVVTLKQLDKFEEVLTRMVQNNRANSVQSIQFCTTQLRKYRDEARDLAIKAAYEKAVALTGALGAKVGKPYSIREDSSGWWSGYEPWWGDSYYGGYGRGYAMNAQVNAQVVAPGGGPSPDSLAAPGQIAVNARVTVSFELQ